MTGVLFGMPGLPVSARDVSRRIPAVQYAPGWYYGAFPLMGTSNQTLTQNTMVAVNGWVTQPIIIDRIGLLVIATALATVRLGVYDDADGLPGRLIVDSGSLDGTGTGVVEAAIYTELPMGQLWFAAVGQGANANTRANNTGTASNTGGPIPYTSAQGQNCASIASPLTVSGELPSSFLGGGVPVAGTLIPHIGFRVAEVL